MAKLKLPSFEEASLLQKTLFYVVTFVLGSAAFIAITSLLVVSAAKAAIPTRNNTDTSASATDKAGAELAPGPTGKPSGRRGRPSKIKAPVEAEAAPVEDTH